MKAGRILKSICALALGAAVIVGSSAAFSMDAYASHDIKATVTGTVQSGSNASTLNLKTAQGDMVIKIDADTTMNTKLMTPGATLYVDVYYGSDAYMHADKISANKDGSTVSSGQKTYNVTGTIADKSMSDNILYVNMGNDQMQLKVDSSTDYSGCGVLYAGKSISAVIYRGDDAYMHAASISDGGSSTSSTTTSYTSGSTTTSTTAVTGTVNADSKSGTLYLDTKDGTYTLKMDSSTNYSNGYMLISGRKVTANIYRGDDAYMHVASTSRAGDLSNTSSGSATATFSGTVSGDSKDSVLYLKTSGGTMTIRLDANTSCSSPIFKGSSVTVSCTNCSDEYWHANSISLK